MRRGKRVSGQGVRRGHRMHRDGVLLMRDRLGEHQVRVRVDAPAAGVKAVQKGVHLSGVCIAESRRPDGLLGAGRRYGIILRHQRLYSETPLGCRLEHGLIVQVPQFKRKSSRRSRLKNTPHPRKGGKFLRSKNKLGGGERQCSAEEARNKKCSATPRLIHGCDRFPRRVRAGRFVSS